MLHTIMLNTATHAASTGASSKALVDGIISTLVFAGVGLVTFLIAFLIIAKLSPFSIRKEIEEDQNTSLGIVIGSVVIGLSIIIAAAIT